MHRRGYLSGLVAGLGAIAGCLGGSGDDSPGGSDDATAETTRTTTSAGTTTAFGDVELPVPEEELNRGASKDGIPAITAPEYGPDWSDVGGESLVADDGVIGASRNGEARAYPLRVLNRHEIVNDDFDGPLLVTFCPLCGSGVTAVRRVDGEETIFGVSGLLWRSDLVMYDRLTESLWSQIIATAIRGPRTGDRLELVPSTMTTWRAWREEHPDTRVLLPPPISETITGRAAQSYDYNPYAGYENSDRIGIGFNDFDDDRLHPKAQVIGVVADDESKAYPLDAVVDADRVVNDAVGDRPVVVAATADDTLVAYERTVGGETLTFTWADDEHLAAGGSRWRPLSGRAVDGPHEGTTLTRANDRSPMFWFAWLDFHPDTALYGG